MAAYLCAYDRHGNDARIPAVRVSLRFDGLVATAQKDILDLLVDIYETMPEERRWEVEAFDKVLREQIDRGMISRVEVD